MPIKFFISKKHRGEASLSSSCYFLSFERNACFCKVLLQNRTLCVCVFIYSPHLLQFSVPKGCTESFVLIHSCFPNGWFSLGIKVPGEGAFKRSHSGTSQSLLCTGVSFNKWHRCPLFCSALVFCISSLRFLRGRGGESLQPNETWDSCCQSKPCCLRWPRGLPSYTSHRAWGSAPMVFHFLEADKAALAQHCLP